MCTHIRIPAEQITIETMYRLDVRGVCFTCYLEAHEEIMCLQHAESDCVFLLDKTEDPDATFWYECDHIPVDLFFMRIADKWNYDLIF